MNPTFKPQHILVSRTDKMGDLLLSLPVFTTLRANFPQAKITALVSPYASELVQGHSRVDAVELLKEEENVSQLAGRLKRLHADTFIALYPRPKIVMAAWMAGIPRRIGTAYRWYGMFLNQRVKVHRSACDRHELEYNLDLIEPLGVTRLIPKIEFPLTDLDRIFVSDFLRERGIPPGTKYVVVHPGHKGSALNWKPQRYAELIEMLSREPGLKVVITGGPDETPLISQVSAFLHSLEAGNKPVLVIGELGFKQLGALYEGADCFISGSTGTMHLAAAVGTPTVALFCPIPETTPVRWGPVGNEATVLMPHESECGNCNLGTCQKHDPMDGIPVDEVFQAVRKHRAKAEKK